MLASFQGDYFLKGKDDAHSPQDSPTDTSRTNSRFFSQPPVSDQSDAAPLPDEDSDVNFIRSNLI